VVADQAAKPDKRQISGQAPRDDGAVCSLKALGYLYFGQ